MSLSLWPSLQGNPPVLHPYLSTSFLPLQTSLELSSTLFSSSNLSSLPSTFSLSHYGSSFTTSLPWPLPSPHFFVTPISTCLFYRLYILPVVFTPSLLCVLPLFALFQLLPPPPPPYVSDLPFFLSLVFFDEGSTIVMCTAVSIYALNQINSS